MQTHSHTPQTAHLPTDTVTPPRGREAGDGSVEININRSISQIAERIYKCFDNFAFTHRKPENPSQVALAIKDLHDRIELVDGNEIGGEYYRLECFCDENGNNNIIVWFMVGSYIVETSNGQ